MTRQDHDLSIAVVATVYRPNSHADVIVSRWLEPRPDDAAWGWPQPRTRIVSMYVEQFAEDDLARGICARNDVSLHDTVSAALCRGGRSLAVDGVLLIGEHGEYPDNEIGQKLYPRKELFDQIVAVFRASGHAVPVFCDKHLSWNFDWARQMDQTARDLGFMLISSSSIPLCRRAPSIDLTGRRIENGVAVFYGPDEAYGYHSYEFVQALIEQRAGGETGVEAITVYQDEDVWRQLDAGRWDADLLHLALEAVRAENPKKIKDGSLRENCADSGSEGPTAICLDYCDGMRLTHLNLWGHVNSWAIAMHVAGEDQPWATAPRVDDGTHFHAHFATLSSVVEEAFLTGTPPFAPERSLLTTGMTAMSMQARAQPGVRLVTPELAIAYGA